MSLLLSSKILSQISRDSRISLMLTGRPALFWIFQTRRSIWLLSSQSCSLQDCLRRELNVPVFSASILIVLGKFKLGMLVLDIFGGGTIDLFIGIGASRVGLLLLSVSCKVVFLIEEPERRLRRLRLLDFSFERLRTADESSFIYFYFGLFGLTFIIYLKVFIFSLAILSILMIYLLY